VIPWLRPDDPPHAFPPVDTALNEPNGLLCVGGDLSPGRLLEAYRRGIFPWYSAGQPILWWSPDPRAILLPHEFRVSRSLAKSLRNRGYATRIDTAFADVVRLCGAADVRREGTWITPAMQVAYEALRGLGYAHCVETWRDDRLVGGLYGVTLGNIFFGESMFSLERDASKVALKRLVDELQARNYTLIDCQVESAHLESLGARALPRAEFLRRVSREIANLDVPAW